MYGILDDGEVKYAIKIPFALSILAHSDPTAEVIGLDQFPEDEIPPLYIHYFFDIMVTIGMWMVVLIVCILGWDETWLEIVKTKWFRWLIVLGGPLSILAIEAGWWMAEVGRQPWILRGIMRTQDAATTSGQVDMMLILLLLYLILDRHCRCINTHVQKQSSGTGNRRSPYGKGGDMYDIRNHRDLGPLDFLIRLYCRRSLILVQDSSMPIVCLRERQHILTNIIQRYLSPVWEVTNVFLVFFFVGISGFSQKQHFIMERRYCSCKYCDYFTGDSRFILCIRNIWFPRT